MLGGTFREIGQDYDTYRPGFPERAADLIVPQHVGTAVDLGAGTGKFTERLIGRADRVVAVEPSEQMLAVLRHKLPAVRALVGGAEAIPLPDASADVVTVAQAFHWFDREPACAEIARVLVAGGRLGLLWNTPDPDCAWDRACYDVAHPGLADDEAAAEPDVPGFELVEQEVVRWTERITRDLYLRRWLTVSSFLAAEPDRRAAMVAELEQILDESPETSEREVLDLRHATEVFVYSSR
nr:class I SAM-dependent methyltransferase [Ornithinimicrobium sp. F0845]